MHVRFTPESGHVRCNSACPLCAISGLVAVKFLSELGLHRKKSMLLAYIRPHTRLLNDRAIYFSVSAADPAADWFQRIHDAGLVRASRFKETPLIWVIFVAWLIAFIEYCLAVPANRYGSAIYSPAQLKTMQEVITLFVFAGFSVLYLNQPITWNHAIGFALIGAGAFFVFRGPL
jgi:uncharacterized protein